MDQRLLVKRREKYGKLGYTINKSNKTIRMDLDLNTLNLMCCYILSKNKNIKRSHLINLRNLIHLLDMDMFSNNAEKEKRIEFIKKGLESRLDKGLTNPLMIIQYINGGIIEDDLIDPGNFNHILSNEEMLWINETVSNSLDYAFIYNNVDNLLDVITRFKSSDYRTKSEIVKELKHEVGSLQQQFRRNEAEDPSDMTFSLHDSIFENVVRDTHASLSSESSRLYTGMQGLNELMGGALENGRVYMLLGTSGSFKSGILLTIAYHLKKYNKNFETKDPTKRPAVVLLTMENTVKESIERLFNMATVGNDIRDFNADEVLSMLKTTGELYLSSDSPIDIIIKYKPNNSIDTSYLYTLVEELEDEGIETICLIQDYVRRIRAQNRQPDIRLEMGEIINEFKVFSSIKDIPVVTAAQLNRDAARTIETGAQAKKSDLIRLLGRSNVGESMLMIDNVDWASLINIEHDSAGNRYLGFNRIKIRGRVPSERHVLYYPFVQGNNMKLVADFDLDVPIFKESLVSKTLDTSLFNDGTSESTTDKLRNCNASVYSSSRKSVEEILLEKKYNDQRDNIFEKHIGSEYISDIGYDILNPSGDIIYTKDGLIIPVTFAS